MDTSPIAYRLVDLMEEPISEPFYELNMDTAPVMNNPSFESKNVIRRDNKVALVKLNVLVSLSALNKMESKYDSSPV